MIILEIGTEIWCAIISGVVTLLVSIGSFQTSVKKDRDKAKEELRTTLDENYRKTQQDIRDLKDDITQVNATVQNQISLVELKIQTLTATVEKHNQVVERVYRLEDNDRLLDERIKVANNRILDLERK